PASSSKSRKACSVPATGSRTVPAGVPSLFQSSNGDVRCSAATKYKDPAATVGRGVPRNANSATLLVPGGVPSVLHRPKGSPPKKYTPSPSAVYIEGLPP